MTVKYSYEGLIKDGVIKRARTGLQVKYETLVLGWNARNHNARWEESIVALTDYLREGGQVPAIEVHLNTATGELVIVEGYRRHESYRRLLAEGRPVDLIDIVPFKGNNAERIARIATSNNQLGLAALEYANMYRELAALHISSTEIAQLVKKSRPHVDDHLLLAYANVDVRNLLESNHVSTETAVKFLREYGEEAGKYLEAELQKARGQGKAKVTKGTVKGKSLPKKIVTGLIASVDSFTASLDDEIRKKLFLIEQAGTVDTETIPVPAKTLQELLDSHGNAEAARAKQSAKQREREAKAAQQELEEGVHG
ncbi:hypothetical protein [Pseudomonas arsenicoxydans]|uniref:ParB-like N-terminal domain-containing protein n=1 Tax=Pseudomonas arsenicoxydans TaxID=702115 RepID=A0A502HT17_9PSED|nr:hypothetical protein [Pseudomonas arsenicoxydans]TPG76328.1 hypothetical protein EAH78_18365 [Pseudomonas arsenicoxydans]